MKMCAQSSLIDPAKKSLIKNLKSFEQNDLIWIQGRIKQLSSANNTLIISDLSGEILVKNLSTFPNDVTWVSPDMLHNYCMVIGYLIKPMESNIIHINAVKVTKLSQGAVESLHEQMWPYEVSDVTRRAISTS